MMVTAAPLHTLADAPPAPSSLLPAASSAIMEPVRIDVLGLIGDDGQQRRRSAGAMWRQCHACKKEIAPLKTRTALTRVALA